MRKKQSSSQREIIRVYCLTSKISLSLTRKTPTRCVCTQQVGLNEKLLFNEEFNDIKQHLARGEKKQKKKRSPWLRGHAQRQPAGIYSFSLFKMSPMVTFNNITH